jgi:hypothetical protein
MPWLLKRGARLAAVGVLAGFAVIQGSALPAQEPLGLETEHIISPLHGDHEKAWDRMEKWNENLPPEEKLSG